MKTIVIGAHNNFRGIMEFVHQENLILKKYQINPQIGKVRYSVSTHNGVDLHEDGSPFWGIKTFANKKDMNKYVSELSKSGYKEV